MSDQNHTPPPQQPRPRAKTQAQREPDRSAAQPPQQAQPTQAAPKKGPEDTLRDRELKASIWKNQGEKRDFYATELARTYEDRDGNLRDSHSFSGDQLLRISELAKGAYHRTNELRCEQAIERKADVERTTEPNESRDDRRESHRDARKPRSRGVRRRDRSR